MNREKSDNNKYFIIEEADAKKRLDVFISEKLNISRSQVKNYLNSIKVNGIEKKLSYALKINDKIEVDINNSDKEIDIENPKAENISLDMIYEDKYILVIIL